MSERPVGPAGPSGDAGAADGRAEPAADEGTSSALDPADAPGATDASFPSPRYGPIALARHAVARYVRFVGRHRVLGCLPLLVLLIALCSLASGLAPRLTPELDPVAELEQLPVNGIGTVIDERDDVVAAYVDAMVAFDADRMWAAYNERVQSELTTRGQGLADLKRGIDEARARGARIDGFERLGSYPLRDGRRYVFYIVRRSGFPPSGANEEIFFVFTVDPGGKIINVT